MSLYLGTHNEKSTTLAVDKLKNSQIASNDSRVWFGQLYGMSDHISFNLGAAGYNATKYMPFGPIREVIPYLSRRATENTSVSGQTGRELSLIRKELKRRKTSRN
jgi:proline dehydrogenase